MRAAADVGDGALADYEELSTHAPDSRRAPPKASTMREHNPTIWAPPGAWNDDDMPQTEPAASSPADSAPAPDAGPRRVVYRLPWPAVALPVIVGAFTAPLIASGGYWMAAAAIPALIALYVITTRTVADPAGLKVHGLHRVRSIVWPDLDTIEFEGQRWGVAVRADGRRVRLPMVVPRDLPTLAAISGGKLMLAVPRRDAAADKEPGAHV